jgi:hypothetical protein
MNGLMAVLIAFAALMGLIVAIQIIRVKRVIPRVWAKTPETLKALVTLTFLWMLAIVIANEFHVSSWKRDVGDYIALLFFPPILGVAGWRWYQRFVKRGPQRSQ